MKSETATNTPVFLTFEQEIQRDDLLALTLQMLSHKVIDLSERLQPSAWRLTPEQQQKDCQWQQRFYQIFKQVYKNEKRSTESSYYKSVYPLVKFIMKTTYWNPEKAQRPELNQESNLCELYVAPKPKIHNEKVKEQRQSVSELKTEKLEQSTRNHRDLQNRQRAMTPNMMSFKRRSIQLDHEKCLEEKQKILKIKQKNQLQVEKYRKERLEQSAEKRFQLLNTVQSNYQTQIDAISHYLGVQQAQSRRNFLALGDRTTIQKRTLNPNSDYQFH